MTGILGDTSVVNLRPRRCDEVRIDGDGRTISIVVGHGVLERVHHVDVDETDGEVVVTPWIGVGPEIAERLARGENVVSTMQLVLWHGSARLREPLGTRCLRLQGDALRPSAPGSAGGGAAPAIRRQYHFWPGEHGLDAWDVHRLIALTTGLPVEEVALADIPEIDSGYWFGPHDRPSVRAMVDHLRMVRDVDPSFPIILGPGNRVMDGMHRVARCLLEGRPTIRAVRLAEIPQPDHRDCSPDSLPY